MALHCKLVLSFCTELWGALLSTLDDFCQRPIVLYALLLSQASCVLHRLTRTFNNNNNNLFEGPRFGEEYIHYIHTIQC